jgi:apolipoprotein N-acyltransferase
MADEAKDDRCNDASARRGRSRSWPLLLAAAAFLAFGNGRYTVPAAAWLGPAFLLRWLRHQRPTRGLALAGLLLAAAFLFQFESMIPAPVPVIAGIALGYSLLGLVPYGLHRLAAYRLKGVSSTLIFPCAWVAVELLESSTPYPTWGALAYTQYGNLALLQLVSVTGLYGVSFLMAWFAAVLDWACEHGFGGSAVRRGILLYASVLAVVLMLGGARMVLFPPSSPTVRVASLTRLDREVRYRANGQMEGNELERVRQQFSAIHDELLGRGRREAESGAKIVFWGEEDAIVLAEDEPTLLARASELAREQAIYLGVSAKVWQRGALEPWAKKLVLLRPDGSVAWSHTKALLLPGREVPGVESGDGQLALAATPYGTVSGAICFEANSPRLMRQAARGGADLVLLPGSDGREIDPWHAQMHVFRAVEGGFNLVRHAGEGLSIAVDYQGRVRAAMDHYETEGDRVMVAQVPTRGVRTVYARVGDLFAGLAVIALALLLAASIKRPPDPERRHG